jgi:hypothetical protein
MWYELGSSSTVADIVRTRRDAEEYAREIGYAQLIARYETEPVTRWTRLVRFEWAGPTHLPVRFGEELYFYARAQGIEFDIAHAPHSIKWLDWPLRLVDSSRSGLVPFEAVYARTDGRNAAVWLWWRVRSLALRAWRFLSARVVLTLWVWGLAYVKPGARPSWRDIGRRSRDGAPLSTRVREQMESAAGKISRTISSVRAALRRKSKG